MEWSVGQTVKMPGATSTSRSPRPGAPVHIRFRFKRGADVSSLSPYPGEREVVLWNKAFRVAKKKRTESGWFYELHEK